ncbi:hypothetical protein Q5P01_011922 [Channa striata]|uniref:Uncharacterized protein n=1 Tax=Channa striata TaxID=64152 RepID=A0AA88MNG7_CHASR|nr:hypothetical protein Q5P01_011922 [Channa striata]
MGSGASQRENTATERPASSQANPESDPANSSPRLPSIVVTAPSREDIYASPSTITIADAIKERRPGSLPFVVGKKIVTRQ